MYQGSKFERYFWAIFSVQIKMLLTKRSHFLPQYPCGVKNSNFLYEYFSEIKAISRNLLQVNQGLGQFSRKTIVKSHDTVPLSRTCHLVHTFIIINIESVLPEHYSVCGLGYLPLRFFHLNAVPETGWGSVQYCRRSTLFEKLLKTFQ